MTLTALLADERYEGKMEGLAEGRAEERLEVVSRMLSRGYSPEQISDILGIQLDEVKALAAKLKPIQ